MYMYIFEASLYKLQFVELLFVLKIRIYFRIYWKSKVSLSIKLVLLEKLSGYTYARVHVSAMYRSTIRINRKSI